MPKNEKPYHHSGTPQKRLCLYTRMNKQEKMADWLYYKLDGEREERELRRNTHGEIYDDEDYRIMKAILRGEKEPGANV